MALSKKPTLVRHALSSILRHLGALEHLWGFRSASRYNVVLSIRKSHQRHSFLISALEIADQCYRLVIGADGVHSHVRQLMWEYAAKEEPGTIPESDKSVMFTQYKAMFGVGKKAAIPELGNSDVNLCYGHGVTKLIFTQPGMVYWAVSFKDEYSQPPKRYRPNAAEQNEVANRFKDIQMTEKTTFGDLWDSKSWGGVLNLEEGILGKWHSGRIVLVGDSAHKVRLGNMGQRSQRLCRQFVCLD
jgi:hypothetical protein